MRALLLMSHTGGGHKASAQALQAGFALHHSQSVDTAMVDLLIDYVAPPLNQLPKTYGVIANHMPWLWQMLWSTGSYPNATRQLMEGIAYLSEPWVVALLQEQRPDLLISVHPLVHELLFHALDVLQWKIPVFTVVTDLASTHPLWFHPRVTACFVASAASYQHALACGLQPTQVRQYGLPVRPAFAAPPPAKAEVRQKVAMHPDLPAVLLVGGGDGIGPVAEIAQQLDAHLSSSGQPSGQLIVICGHNQSLYQELRAIQWRIPVQLHGFVDNMPQWMAAADCIVTKAGPGTIAEATIAGLPIVLSSFIPGQEEGNLPFVVESGAGAFCEDPAQIGQMVARWFGPERQQLTQMSARSRQLARPDATAQITQAILKLSSATPPSRRPVVGQPSWLWGRTDQRGQQQLH